MPNGTISVSYLAMDNFREQLENPRVAMDGAATGFGANEGAALKPSDPQALPAGKLLKSKNDKAIESAHTLLRAIRQRIEGAQTTIDTIATGYRNADETQADEMKTINSQLGGT